MPAVRVAIVMSTYNGAQWLPAQLASLTAQTHDSWTLYWRDDGSTDDTTHLMHGFRSGVVAGPAGHLGPARSFLGLLRSVAGRLAATDLVAFADQDDVWLPAKLARGVAALGAVTADRPALYCARQILVDASLEQIRLSDTIAEPVGFPAALTQNVATGCTVMLNGAAARLVAASEQPDTMHDWWCYLLISAAGGAVLVDDDPSVLYRQHGRNAVGAPSSALRRGVNAMRRGPAPFMETLRRHLTALSAQPQLLTPGAREQIAAIARALDGGPLRRAAVLGMPGLRRQTWFETLVFRLWFVMGLGRAASRTPAAPAEGAKAQGRSRRPADRAAA